MPLDTQLYTGADIVLTAINHDKDAEIVARWTNDDWYLRMLSMAPARPRNAAQIKKEFEAIEKEVETDRNRYYYHVRLKDDERLVGFCELLWIDWVNGGARVRIGIGEADCRGKGYGRQALRLLLGVAFEELNLFRLDTAIAEYNIPALRLFQGVGFVEEVRQRALLVRDGKRYDMLHLGLLAEEYKP